MIQGNEFADSFTDVGAAVYATECPGILIADNDIHDNEAVAAAGVHVQQSVGVQVTGNTFRRCGEAGMFGQPLTTAHGAVSLWQCSEVVVADNLIEDCHVEEVGIVGLEASSGTVADNVIRDCSAGLEAVVFSVINCDGLLVARNILERNGGGAGVPGVGEIRDSSAVVLEDNRFVACDLGFVALRTIGSQPVTLRRCSFEDGETASSGTIALLALAPTTVEDCLVVDHGTGVVAEAAVTIRRSTFSRNSAEAVSVGAGSSVEIESSILFENGSVPGGPEITGAGAAIVSDSLVLGGFPGTNVLDADPVFVDAAAGDFRLRASSPCIDVGDPADGTCGVDLGGRPRLVSGLFTTTARVDMGAYEFSQVILTVTPLGGNSFQVKSSGPIGLPTLMFVATEPAELCLPPAGTLLVDLFGPSIVAPWVPLPSQVTVTFPAGAPDELWIQQLVLGPTPGTANLSGAELVAFD